MRDKSDLLFGKKEIEKLCELFFMLSRCRSVSSRSIALWMTMFSYVYVHSNQSIKIGMFNRLRRAILLRTYAKLLPRGNYSTVREGAKQIVTLKSTTRTDASLRYVKKMANRVHHKTQNERVKHRHNTTDVLQPVRYSFYERCLFYVNKLACVGKLQYKRALRRKQASNDNDGVLSASRPDVLSQYAEQRHKRRLTLVRSLRWAMRDRHGYGKRVKHRQRVLQNAAMVLKHNKQKHNTILPQFISLLGSTKPLCLLHSNYSTEAPTNWLLREIARCRSIITVTKMHVSRIVASFQIRRHAEYRLIAYIDILHRLYKSTAYVACIKYKLHDNTYHLLSSNMANKQSKNWTLPCSKQALLYTVLLMILRYRYRKGTNSLFSKILSFFKVMKRLNTSVLQRTKLATYTIMELTPNRNMRSIRRWFREKQLIVKSRRKLRRHIKYYAHTRRSGKAKWYHV